MNATFFDFASQNQKKWHSFIILWGCVKSRQGAALLFEKGAGLRPAP
jgi:hypothetical protein